MMEQQEKVDRRVGKDKSKEKYALIRVRKNSMLSAFAKLFLVPIYQMASHNPMTRILKLFVHREDRTQYFATPAKDIPNDVEFRAVPVYTMNDLVSNTLFNSRIDWTTMLRCSHEKAARVVCEFVLYQLIKYIYTTGNGVQIGRFVVVLRETERTLILQIALREKGVWRNVSKFRDGRFKHWSVLCFSKKLMEQETRINKNIKPIKTI